MAGLCKGGNEPSRRVPKGSTAVSSWLIVPHSSYSRSYGIYNPKDRALVNIVTQLRDAAADSAYSSDEVSLQSLYPPKSFNLVAMPHVGRRVFRSQARSIIDNAIKFCDKEKTTGLFLPLLNATERAAAVVKVNKPSGKPLVMLRVFLTSSAVKQSVACWLAVSEAECTQNQTRRDGREETQGDTKRQLRMTAGSSSRGDRLIAAVYCACLDDRPPLFWHVDVRPAAGWSVWALHAQRLSDDKDEPPGTWKERSLEDDPDSLSYIVTFGIFAGRRLHPALRIGSGERGCERNH
ncbi:hypothetical protein ANN_01049 [Periplaneta americana]|uniref:Uncharacterized protein n=1 Tax=Periplaneta americana TaxID=6978 RepID=A0ABQ8TVK0_PERAM|nr:hypothetical protein ANN_01049 [Periplaneta americana]